MHFVRFARVLAGFVVALVAGTAGAAPKGATPFPANDSSLSPSLSADGRMLAFVSSGSNLVAGDTNGVDDIFVIDRNDDSIRRVSTNAFGGQADGESWSPSISPDGRWLAFASNASNLVTGDTNGDADVFRKDLQTGEVVRVSIGDAGQQGEILDNVAPETDANFVSITRGGRFVVFQTCLVPLIDFQGCGAMLRDVDAGTTRRVTNDRFYARNAIGVRATAGGLEVSIATTSVFPLVPADVEFSDNDDQDVYLARTTIPPTGAPTPFTYLLLSAAPGGGPGNAASGSFNIGRGVSISEDGLRVAFPSAASDLVAGDTNDLIDAFVYDVAGATLTRESDGIAFPGGGCRLDVAPMLSPDGAWLLYFEAATFCQDDWVLREVATDAETVIGEGIPAPGTDKEGTGHGAVSNGGTVAVWPTARFDLPGTRLDFVHDVFVSAGSPRTTTLASRARIGTDREGHSRAAAISGNGRYVAFASNASTFDPADPGGNGDIYVKDLTDGSIARATSQFQVVANFAPDFTLPVLSADGNRVAYYGGGTPNGASCVGGSGLAWVTTLRPALATRCLDADISGFANVQAEDIPPPTLSANGNVAAFQGAQFGMGRKLWAVDLGTNTLERLDNIMPTQPIFYEDGQLGLSGDGRYLVHPLYLGEATGSVAVYDRVTDVDTVASRINGNGPAAPARWGAISADGNWVAFVSNANLTQESPAPPGDQVYVVERATQAITRIVGDSVGRNDGTFKARVRLSADGRHVSWIADDFCTFRCGSQRREVVRYDRATGSLRTISLTPSWGRPNGASAPPEKVFTSNLSLTMDMSADGGKIVFASSATNLAPSDRNAADDIYLVEADSQSVTLVSAPGARAAGDFDRVAPELSADGGTLAYAMKDRDGATASTGSTAKRAAGVTGNKWSDVAVHTRLEGERLVSVAPGGGAANGDSGEPSISRDGRFIAYQSDATNLTPDADTNDATDIVMYDAASAANVQVTRTATGLPANGASFDPAVALGIGNKFGVAFTSSATNLGTGADTNGVLDVMFALEGDGGAPPTTVPVSVATNGTASNGPSAQADIDSDATFVTFASLGNNLSPGDTNNTTDVFLRNLATNETVLLSTAPGGAPANGPSTNIVGDKFGPSPTAPPIVAFESDATNLAGIDLNGATDVYAWTPSLGMFAVSRGMGGTTANGTSSSPQLSRGGRFIAYVSTADNIVPGDGNGRPDVFVFDTQTQVTKRISLGSGGQEADDVTTSAAVGVDAAGNAVVAWDSAAKNLLEATDPDEAFDLFLSIGDAPPEPVLPDGVLVFRNGFE